MSSRKPLTKGQQRAYLIFFGIIAAVTVPVMLFGHETPTVDGRDAAINSCHDAVTNQLLSPSSAQFSGDDVNTSDSVTYTVSGVVDAQNAFGAMVRGGWSCTAIFDGTAANVQSAYVLDASMMGK